MSDCLSASSAAKPRILFVLRYHFTRFTGGAEMQAWMMATELARRGWDVHYAGEMNTVPQPNLMDGVTLHALPENPSYWEGNRAPLRKLLHALRPDVIYTRTFDPYVGYTVQEKPRDSIVVWAAASKIDGDRWPLFAHRWRALSTGLFLKRLPVYAYQNHVARKGRAGADLVLAQHRDQMEQLARLGLKSLLLRNSHPPVPDSSVQTHEGRPVILWADSVKAIKRPEVFLELAKRCADLDAEFVMIGRIYSPHYQALIEATSRAAANFRYEGSVPLSEVSRYFAAAHLHVKTSLPIEGFPNTFIQAWLHGIPVASLEVDPEHLIRAHSLGRCASTPDELEQSVRELISDLSLRRQLGQNARAFAMQEFNLQNNMDKFEQLVAERISR